MFERLNTPQEAYNYKLGAALKMERTVLEMLEDNEKNAQDEQVAQLFRHHQDETREQISNLEQAFTAFGWEVDDSPCPAIEGIQKEGKANAKKTADSIVDSVLLTGAAGTRAPRDRRLRGPDHQRTRDGPRRRRRAAAEEPRAGGAHAVRSEGSHAEGRRRLAQAAGLTKAVVWRDPAIRRG
jgi:hypothetical protein